MKNIAIIPIGGIGLRMHTNYPKQFLLINDKPLFIYTVEKFEKNDNISDIVISCKQEYKDYVLTECKKYNINKLYCVCQSGRTQLETIFNSINEIKDNFSDNDKIVIHVGNRPNLSLSLIDKCINKHDELGPVTTVIPCIESMIDINNKAILKRDDIKRIQTPQVYSFKDVSCYSDNSDDYYDKGSTMCDLFILDNKKINFIDGEIANFKITYPEDYEMFKLIVGNK